jgi:two-component system, NarL family, nitrate/nitrite response regulator NarL
LALSSSRPGIEGDASVTAIQRAMRGASVVAEEMTGKLVAAYRGAAAAPAASEVAATAHGLG